MKRIILCIAVLLFTAGSVLADTYVRGYTRSNGSYVAPHYRSSPNKTRSDNWSTRGNVNPYTGIRGTKSQYGSSYGTTSNPYGKTSSGWGSM